MLCHSAFAEVHLDAKGLELNIKWQILITTGRGPPKQLEKLRDRDVHCLRLASSCKGYEVIKEGAPNEVKGCCT